MTIIVFFWLATLWNYSIQSRLHCKKYFVGRLFLAKHRTASKHLIIIRKRFNRSPVASSLTGKTLPPPAVPKTCWVIDTPSTRIFPNSWLNPELNTVSFPPRPTCDLASQFRLVLGDRGEEAFANHLLLHLSSTQSTKARASGFSLAMGKPN